MRSLIAAALAAGVLSVAGAAEAASPTAAYEAMTWRLIRTYEPMPGLQRGYDYWVSEADLQAAAGSKAGIKTVRMLGGKPDGWTVSVSRYECGKGRAELVSSTRVEAGKVTTKREARGLQPIIPHGPDGIVYDLACSSPKPSDAPTVTGPAAAFAFQAKTDAEFVVARAAYDREQVALQKRCEGNVLKNPEFAADAKAAGYVPPVKVDGWEAAPGPLVWTPVPGGQAFAFSPGEFGPLGLAQRGLSLKPGDYALSAVAKVIGGARLKLRAVVKAGAAEAAVAETPWLTADGTYVLFPHLTAPADSLTLFAVYDPAQKLEPGKINFAIGSLCLDPAS